MRFTNFVCTLGLVWAIACSARHRDATYAALSGKDAGATCGCGDGVVGPDEECDPRAPGWADACDDACRRTVYAPCSAPEDCPGANANCSAYTSDPDQVFCADYCEDDDDCPRLPGFDAVCNFAWCAVLCDQGVCPHGMRCVADQPLIDRAGASKGTAYVCVIKS
ncbi:MAG TPA: hypothetical protein VJR89_17725 [Polyangiales bacterium]|nr:hypothetical protein [Polyangiales bacterium]